VDLVSVDERSLAGFPKHTKHKAGGFGRRICRLTQTRMTMVNGYDPNSQRERKRYVRSPVLLFGPSSASRVRST